MHLLKLKRETIHMSHDAEAKIVLLREVIRRVQDGEAVDVKKELGTGDPVKEKEWEDVLRELEDDSTFGEKTMRRRAQRQEKVKVRREEREKSRQDQMSSWPWGLASKDKEPEAERQADSHSEKIEKRKPAFY
jgi:hypothetical protein